MAGIGGTRLRPFLLPAFLCSPPSPLHRPPLLRVAPGLTLHSPLCNMTVATIGQTATAVPEHILGREELRAAARAAFQLRPERLPAVLALFDSAGVERRHSVLPPDLLPEKRDLSATMALYREHAVRLGRQVTSDCLARAGLAPRDVDLVISVSCTGVMLPSLDAYLANELGFRPDVRRLPITELGCLGGAAALSYARDFILAHPEANVLVVSVELPTLSFQRDDHSAANIVSTAIFGDGAAAALVTGRPVPGAELLASQSHLFPASLDVLGFDLERDGFHVVLARELPGIVRREMGALINQLLDRARVTRESIRSFVFHPGGRRILEALEEVLEIRGQETAPSREVLRDHGNVSSATVLFVLDEWLNRRRPPAGAHGLLGAFGPGFSSELLVLRWT
jgi:alkylresorcinol/alkylpyrone synthase